MTGELALIGRFARAFGDYVGPVREVPGPDIHMGLGLGTHSVHGFGWLGQGVPLVRGAAQSAALSDWAQPARTYTPGLGLRLSDIATRNPYAFGVQPALGMRVPEPEQAEAQ